MSCVFQLKNRSKVHTKIHKVYKKARKNRFLDMNDIELKDGASLIGILLVIMEVGIDVQSFCFFFSRSHIIYLMVKVLITGF